MNEFAKGDPSLLDKTRRNPWMITSFVLGALLIVSLGYLLVNGTSESTVKENMANFMKNQGITGEVVGVSKENGMYKLEVEIDGSSVPVFIIPDGNYLFSEGIKINGVAVADSKNPRGSEVKNVEVPKSDKPVVELFVMSHCPYGTQAEKGMLPVATLLKNKIDFKVKFVYYAMHGKTEVDEQLNQYCIQKEQNSKYLTYLKCFLTDGDGESCLKNASVNTVSMNSCVSKTDKEFGVTESYKNKDSWLSGRFPLFDVNKADNDKYGIAGSPSLVINGVEVQVGRDSASVLSAVCGAFNEEPSECNTELDSTSPGPGFGWDASGSANLAACGA